MQPIVSYLAQQPGRCALVRDLRQSFGLTADMAQDLIHSGTGVFALHHDLPRAADPDSVVFIGSECITALALREGVDVAPKKATAKPAKAKAVRKMPERKRATGTIRLIAAAMERQGLTVYALGKASGVDQSIIGRFLVGERDLTLANAERIFEALGLELVAMR